MARAGRHGIGRPAAGAGLNAKNPAEAGCWGNSVVAGVRNQRNLDELAAVQGAMVAEASNPLSLLFNAYDLTEVRKKPNAPKP